MDGHTVRRSESVANLAAALCKAQAEVKAPAKNKQNPHLKNWYADLAAVAEAVLPAFLRHGLSVTQLPCELGGDPAVMTLVLHTSGEWLETVARTRPVKADPQGAGSALTYAKRYALQSIAGVVAEDDDDGHAATHRPQPQQKPASQPSPFVVLRNLLQNSTAEPALKSAYGAAYKAHEKGDVTDEEFAKLTALKDTLKAKLAAQPA